MVEFGLFGCGNRSSACDPTFGAFPGPLQKSVLCCFVAKVRPIRLQNRVIVKNPCEQTTALPHTHGERCCNNHTPSLRGAHASSPTSAHPQAGTHTQPRILPNLAIATLAMTSDAWHSHQCPRPHAHFSSISPPPPQPTHTHHPHTQYWRAPRWVARWLPASAGPLARVPWPGPRRGGGRRLWRGERRP